MNVIADPVPAGTIAATPPTGLDKNVSVQMSGSSLLQVGDLHFFGVRYGNSPSSRSTTLSWDARLPGAATAAAGRANCEQYARCAPLVRFRRVSSALLTLSRAGYSSWYPYICQLFVALAEECWTEGTVARAAAARYLLHLLALRGLEDGAADILVLGRPLAVTAAVNREVIGAWIRIVDAAPTDVARFAAFGGRFLETGSGRAMSSWSFDPSAYPSMNQGDSYDEKITRCVADDGRGNYPNGRPGCGAVGLGGQR